MKTRRRKYIQALAVVAVLGASTLAVSGCAAAGIQFGRVNTLAYHANVFTNNPDAWEEVTLYLPFPRYKGQPVSQVLKDARRGEELEYRATLRGAPRVNGRIEPGYEPPKVTLGVVDTRYGKMLKVHATGLRGKTGFDLEGKYTYTNLLPVGDPSKEYPLEPVPSVGRPGAAYVYVDRNGGTGLYLHLVYDATFTDQYLPVMSGSPGQRWLIGSHYDESAATNPRQNNVEIGKQGWVEVPVWQSK